MTAPRPLPHPRGEGAKPAPSPTPQRRPSKLTIPTRAGSALFRGARTGWTDSRAAARAEKDQPKARRFEPPFDTGTWTGALIFMTLFTALLWVVEIVDQADDGKLRRFGLEPRNMTGLRGIVLSPFLSESYRHVLSNTFPVVLIGWVVLLAGLRVWAVVSVSVIVVGGLLTWLIGPSNVTIVGASGLVFGWLGYLIARAWFSRKITWILAAIVVLLFFGTLLAGLLPHGGSTDSWQAHVSGFVAGVGIGWLLHPRGSQLRQFRRGTT